MTVEVHHPVNITVSTEPVPANPFLVQVTGTFRKHGCEDVSIPAFYDGEGKRHIRFSPCEAGEWKWESKCDSEPNLNASGCFTASSNSNQSVHGGLLVDPDYPNQFLFEDGTGCFMMAFEADWLFSLFIAYSGENCHPFRPKAAT